MNSSTIVAMEVIKGRMYDYNNGRFLSVDPFIQAPTSTQSMNPYTYIFNNPLSGTDPTGYKAKLEDDVVKKTTRNVAPTGSHIKSGKQDRVTTENGDIASITSFGGEIASTSGIDFSTSKGASTQSSKSGGTSGIGEQNLLAQNDLSAQEKNRLFKCETLGSNYPGCSGSDFQNGLNNIKKGAGIVADELGNPINYIGGGVYKVAGKVGVYLIKVGDKLVPFTKLIGLSKNAKFAQKTFRNEFSDRGIVELERITGVSGIRSVDQLSTAIVKGKVNPADIHINIINRNGTDLILNTRSAHALEGAGIPRSSFTVIDRTGDVKFEQMLTEQLKRNNLTSDGVSKVTKEY